MATSRSNEILKIPEIDWMHPAIGANPMMMGMANLAAAQKTLVEAYQKKWLNFMLTGVWE